MINHAKTSSAPKPLRPLIDHGMDLVDTGKSNWSGTCPYCGKEKHLFANEKTGQWDCKVCGKSGNAVSYMTDVAKRYSAALTAPKMIALARQRRLPASVLKAAGIGWDEDRQSYTLPVFSETGTVRDIRRYSLKSKKRKLMSTSGAEAQLWGSKELAAAKPGTVVWKCEGEWDGMAMRWLLDQIGRTGDVVVAVPGATTLKKEWPERFAGMRVRDLSDNDEAGDNGQAKTFAMITQYAAEVKYIHWPDLRPTGYDVRDLVCDGAEAGKPPDDTFAEIESMLRDRPRREPVAKKGTVGEAWKPPEGMEPLRPMELDEVRSVFEEHIYMTDEMNLILDVMLATAMSNDVKSDPIWLYVVGPPGSGKTLLLTSFQGSERCVFRSTLTPASLVSGWKSDGGDPSLIPRLNGKTLVAKDFTEILDMPTLMQDEIFSTLRGAFDGHVQKSFGNGIQREYRDCHFSILAGVTHAIHGHRKAHLGERFLRLEMTSLDQEHMDAVLRAAIDSIGAEHDVELKLQHAVACFLQKKIEKPPRLSDAVRTKLRSLVKLIAMLRSQVTRDPRTGEISYRPKAELGTRLAKQLAKLGSCLAFVRGKEEVDDEIYEVMRRVAFDTVGGYSLDIVTELMRMGGRGTKADVGDKIGASGATLHRRVEDLTLTGILSRHQAEETGPKGGRPPAEYVVSKDVSGLWNDSSSEEQRKETSWRPGRSSRGKTSSGSSIATSASRPTSTSDSKSSRESSRRSKPLLLKLPRRTR